MEAELVVFKETAFHNTTLFKGDHRQRKTDLLFLLLTEVPLVLTFTPLRPQYSMVKICQNSPYGRKKRGSRESTHIRMGCFPRLEVRIER